MSLVRMLGIAALLLVATAVPSYSQQHWLIGTWKGELGGLPSGNRYGADRTLTVTAVDGGSAKAQWVGPQVTQTVTLKIDGDTVTFATPGAAGGQYQLSHKGNVMSGTWQGANNNKSGPIELKKQ